MRKKVNLIYDKNKEMSNKLKINFYQEGDYEKYLFDISKENMKDYCDRHFELGWSDKVNKENFFNTLKNRIVYTLELDSVIIGFFSLEVKKKELYIKEIQIKKKFQGRGFGKICFNFIESLAKKYNCVLIGLTVFKDNPAKLWYEKMGFKIIEEKFNGAAFKMIKMN